MVKLKKVIFEQASGLEDKVAFLLNGQNNRIQMITDTFNEALKLIGNKTYFLEEMSKQKIIKKGLKKQVAVME